MIFSEDIMATHVLKAYRYPYGFNLSYNLIPSEDCKKYIIRVFWEGYSAE